MKKLFLVFGFCLLFSTNLEAAQMYGDVNDYVVYDDVNTCVVANSAMSDSNVTYNKIEGSECVESILYLMSFQKM